VLTALSISSSPGPREGKYPQVLISALEESVMERVQREQEEGKKRVFCRVTLLDLNVAEEKLHSKRIKEIRAEIMESMSLISGNLGCDSRFSVLTLVFLCRRRSI